MLKQLVAYPLQIPSCVYFTPYGCLLRKQNLI